MAVATSYGRQELPILDGEMYLVEEVLWFADLNFIIKLSDTAKTGDLILITESSFKGLHDIDVSKDNKWCLGLIHGQLQSFSKHSIRTGCRKMG